MVFPWTSGRTSHGRQEPALEVGDWGSFQAAYARPTVNWALVHVRVARSISPLERCEVFPQRAHAQRRRRERCGTPWGASDHVENLDRLVPPFAFRPRQSDAYS